MDNLTGQVLGRFRILELLGSGGMGTVYHAEDLKHGQRHVALKFLRPEIADRPERRDLLRTEISALAQLNHPYITTLFDSYEENGHFFFAMDYVEGETLADHLRAGAMPLPRALTVSRQIAEALAHAHGRNIIHRDVKPANVKIAQEGFVKLMDFGLAALAPAPVGSAQSTVSETLTTQSMPSPDKVQPAVAGRITGTPAYMSPEQTRGWRIDPRSDMFAFGAVLYEMITGERLFRGASKLELLRAVREQPNPVMDPGALGVPEELTRLVRGCLEKAPQDRPPNMHAVLDRLRALQGVLVSARGRHPTRPIPLPPQITPVPEDPFRVSMVGRNPERDRIGALLEQSGAEHGGTLIFEGEAGAGKTRLVEWSLELAVARGGMTGRGACVLRGGAPPFHPFVEAAATLLDGIGLRTTEDLDSFFDDTQCPEPMRTAILQFLGLSERSDATPDQVLAGASHLFASVARNAKRLLVLAIEDLHWADDATIDLFCFLAHRLSGVRLALIGTFRPDPGEITSAPSELPQVRLLDRVAARPDVEIRTLERLSRRELRELIASAAPGLERDDTSVGVLFEASAGNPLFAVEYLRELKRDGRLLESGDGYELREGIRPSTIPRRVQEVLERRIGRLERDEREVLEIAAILGDPIDTAAIARVLGLSRLQLLRSVKTLHGEHHLLAPTDAGFRFDHARIRELVLHSLGEPVRQEYHLLVSEAMAELYGEHEEQAAAIAMHLVEGGRESKAVPYLVRAGHGAERTQALAEADRYFTSALSYQQRHDPSDASRWELIRSVVEVKHKIGDDAGAQSILERALREKPGPPDDSVRALALIALAASRTRLADYPGSRRRLEEADAIAGESGRREIRLLLLLEKANVQLREAEYSSALQSLEEAAVLAEQGSPEAATVHYKIGQVHFFMGEYGEAGAGFRRARDEARDAGDLRRESTVLNALGNLSRVEGQLEEARRLGAKALALAREVGDRRGLSHASNNLALTLASLGAQDHAIEMHRQSLELKQELGDLQGESNSLHNLADLCYHTGKLAQGLRYARSALDIKRSIGDTSRLAPVLVGHGNLLAGAGKLREAHAAFEEALRVTEVTGEEDWGIRTLAFVGELYLGEGRYQDSLEAYSLAADRAETAGMVVPRLNALHGVVRSLGHLGRRKAMMRAAERIVEIASELDNPQVVYMLDEARAIVAWSEGRLAAAAVLFESLLERARVENRAKLQRWYLHSLAVLSECVEPGSGERWIRGDREIVQAIAAQFEDEDDRRAVLVSPVALGAWREEEPSP